MTTDYVPLTVYRRHSGQELVQIDVPLTFTLGDVAEEVAIDLEEGSFESLGES